MCIRDSSYTVLDVPDLKEAIPVLCGLDCFNVTIPHKNAIIPFLDEVEEKAKASGSVNTVQVKQGRLFGYTTDGAGCRAALKNHGTELSGKVLLLGNGGAARAIAFEAAECPGTSLTIVSRENSVEKGQKLCSDLQKYRGVGREVRVLTYAALESEKTEFDVLINATSAGMYPHTGECPVSDVYKRQDDSFALGISSGFHRFPIHNTASLGNIELFTFFHHLFEFRRNDRLAILIQFKFWMVRSFVSRLRLVRSDHSAVFLDVNTGDTTCMLVDIFYRIDPSGRSPTAVDFKSNRFRIGILDVYKRQLQYHQERDC